MIRVGNMAKVFGQLVVFICILILALSISTTSNARSKKSQSYNFFPGTYMPGHVYVREHTKKDGTRVNAHRRTRKNSDFYDNWSTEGNVNPYTGKKGTRKR